MNKIEIEQTKEQEVCDILYKFMSHCEVEECIELLRPYLQSLQEPTEERDVVEIKRNRKGGFHHCPCGACISVFGTKYCFECGKKLKRIK